MKETELAEAIIDYLNDGWEVYKEVAAHGIIDIIAYHKPIVSAIECKLTFGLSVIEQADRNKQYANYSYVAVPAPRVYGSFAEKLCKERGIGVLALDRSGRVMERIRPRLNRNVVKIKLNEWQKESVAGSVNNRMTAFKNTCRLLTRIVQERGGRMEIKEAIKSIDHHYGSFSSAKSCIISMIGRGIIKDLAYDKGILKLTTTEQVNARLKR